jgi:hypothetical protein
MSELFKFIDIDEIKIRNSYNILEFGSGDSSIKIANIFSNIDNLTYYTYESNSDYIQKHNKIINIEYDENNIQKIKLSDNIYGNIQFDLVLVDGPNGDNRKFWYNKFKYYCKIGTIILIDDFNHYTSFGEELDKNFEYELLSFNDEPFVPYGEHSWKIVKVLNIL